MPDRACDCCGSTGEQATERTATDDRWLGERPVTDAVLPPGMAEIARRFLADGSIETLGDLVETVSVTADDGPVTIDDLCHAPEQTPHRATMGEETYHFLCFFDGIALAHIADGPVTIETESPTGETVEARATPDGNVAVSPPDAAMSFGVATDVGAPADGGPTLGELYEAFCPYVKAFHSREAYERWAEGADAATVGMSLVAGVPIAAALAE